MQDLVIGIDVGGTKIAAGLIDCNARFIARYIPFALLLPTGPGGR